MSTDEAAREAAIDVLKAHVDGENYALWHVLETLGRALLERDATITELRTRVLETTEHRSAVLNAHHDLGYPEWGKGPCTEWPRKAREQIQAERAAREKAERERDRLRKAASELRTAHSVASRAPLNSNGQDARQRESEAWVALYEALAPRETPREEGR